MWGGMDDALAAPENALFMRLPDDVKARGALSRYPVERWTPAKCGDSHMRIDRNGGWWHEGRPIARVSLARLFARLLRREPDGRYVLVTPVEMLDIAVEDAPLIASEVESSGSGEARTLRFRIALLDDWVEASGDRPIIIEQAERGPRPYLQLHAGLRARIDRPVYYALADLILADGIDQTGLWSGGFFHQLGDAS